MKNSNPLKGVISDARLVHYDHDKDYIVLTVTQKALHTEFRSDLIIWDVYDTELDVGDTISYYTNGLFINWYRKEKN